MANKTICALTYGDTHVFTLPYGTCSTAAGTAAKTVSVQDGKFSLETGARVCVKFTTTNTASNPTLNVSSTGAKSIMHRGSAITANQLTANRVYDFIYDGTDWELIGDVNIQANSSTAGITKLYTASECTSFSSDDGACTPAAAKKVAQNPFFNVNYSASSASQVDQPRLTWKTVGSNTPYIGYAQDQSDGTFILGSLKGGSSYKNGLAIGGGSGNLLWKGERVATANELNQYSTLSEVKDIVDDVSNYNFVSNWNLQNPINSKGFSTYQGAQYTIDNWYATDSTNTVTINQNNYTTITNTSSSKHMWFRQYLNCKYLSYGTYTLSVLVENCGDCSVYFCKDDGNAVENKIYALQPGLNVFTQTIEANTCSRIQFVIGYNTFLSLKGVKIERGTLSTLAIKLPNNNYSLRLENWDPSIENMKSDTDLVYKIGDVKITQRTDLGSNWVECNGSPADVISYPGYGQVSPVTVDSPYFIAKTTSISTTDPLTTFNNFGFTSCKIHDTFVFDQHTFYNIENSSVTGANRYYVAMTTNGTSNYKLTRTSGASTAIHINDIKYIDNHYFLKADFDIIIFDSSLNAVTISNWPSTVSGGSMGVIKDSGNNNLYVYEAYDGSLDVFLVNLTAKTATKQSSLSITDNYFQFLHIYNGRFYYATGSSTAYLRVYEISSGSRLVNTSMGSFDSERSTHFIHNNYIYVLPNNSAGSSAYANYSRIKIGSTTVEKIAYSLGISDGSSNTFPNLKIFVVNNTVYYIPTSSGTLRYIWILNMSSNGIDSHYKISTGEGKGLIGHESIELISTNNPKLVLQTTSGNVKTIFYQTCVLPEITLTGATAYIKMA